MTLEQPTPARVVKGRLVGAPFLDDARLRRLLAVLEAEGDEARAVGGAVRNALLGAPVHEVDVATTATPDVVTARARAAGLRAIPTGIAHGTVTVLVDGVPFEVTTLREDIATDGRHATVRFGRDFRADALRRDFTINALSVGADGRLHDYAGGLADIAVRRVRFIGDARTRIREDFLRILRFFRFHAACAGATPLDTQGFEAAIAERDGLALLSRERVRAELMKLVVAPGAAFVAAAMEHAGLLGRCLAGLSYPQRLERFTAREAALGLEPDSLPRLAALAVLIAEDADRLAERLRLSNAEAARLARAAAALAPLHGARLPPAPGELRRYLFLHGRRAALDGLALAHVESSAPAGDPSWSAAMRFLAETPEPTLPFSGADLLARGVPAGRGIGAILKRLQANWIRAGFPQEPAALAALLDEAVLAEAQGEP